MEQRGVIQHGPDKVVHHARSENVRVIQLAFVLRLVALDVENRIDRVRVRRLGATIEFHSAEDFVLVAELIIHAAAEQPFAVSVWH